jgi:hypothetical protein
MTRITAAAMLFASLPGSLAVAQDVSQHVDFRSEDTKLIITVNDKPIATYVYSDSKIPRPYFAHVKTLDGVQVTRHHPPLVGKDRVDHDTMHPGIWIAFGDLDGSDFWRNKAKIVHVSFLEEPVGGNEMGAFVEEKHYLRADGTLACKELFRCSVYARNDGYLLGCDSTFYGDTEFYFGDQEEMGLGLRVATAISEVNGGQLLDSEGRKGAKRIWSHAAAWCDYGGTVGDQRIGMTLMCHPGNFRESWMHARDYGFVAANPFGRQSMKKGPASKMVVKAGEELRLRYGIWVHHGPCGRQPAYDAAFANYLKLAHRGDRLPASLKQK